MIKIKKTAAITAANKLLAELDGIASAYDYNHLDMQTIHAAATVLFAYVSGNIGIDGISEYTDPNGDGSNWDIG